MNPTPFLLWLARATIESSALFVLIYLLTKLLSRRLTAAWRCNLWLVVFVRSLLPGGVPFHFAEPAFREHAPAIRLVTVNPAPPLKTLPVIGAYPRREISATPLATPHRPIDWQLLLFTLWSLGTVFLLVRTGLGCVLLAGRIGKIPECSNMPLLNELNDVKDMLGLRYRVRARTLPQGSSPAITGFLRPTLLIPEGLTEMLTPVQLRMVLLHELAHLKRHDLLLGWLSVIAGVIHWFNPFLWRAIAHYRLERELACDEFVLGRTTEPGAYGQTLLALVRPMEAFTPALSIAASSKNLTRRIDMIAKYAPLRGSRLMAITMFALLVALAGVDPLLAQHAEAPATQRPIVTRDIASTPATEPAGFAGATDVSPIDLQVGEETYLIGTGDVLKVTVQDLMGSGTGSGEMVPKVDADGTIPLKYIRPVKATGSSVAELQAAIARAYGDASMIRNAVVDVQVTDPRSHTCTIQGNVAYPGEFIIPRADFRLINALAISKGPVTPVDTAYVLRKRAGAATEPAAEDAARGGYARIIRVPLAALLNGQLQYNLVIRPGDTIMIPQPMAAKEAPIAQHAFTVIVGKDGFISIDNQVEGFDYLYKAIAAQSTGERAATLIRLQPQYPDVRISELAAAKSEADKIAASQGVAKVEVEVSPASNAVESNATAYVAGHVQHPGAYALTGHQTLKQLIIASGGPDNPDSYVSLNLIRHKDGNEVYENNIDYHALMEGKRPDVYVAPEDMIVVNSDARLTALHQQLDQAQAILEADSSKYASSHPVIVKDQERINVLKAAIEGTTHKAQ